MGSSDGGSYNQMDVNKMDKPWDGAFKEQRKCTDVLFLILFIAFWIGMFAVAGVGFSKGNPKRLYYGSDYEGNVCGLDNSQWKNTGGRELLEEKNLYWPNIVQYPQISICVANCPTAMPPATIMQYVCGYNVCWEKTDKCEKERVAALAKSHSEPGNKCWFPLRSEAMFARCLPINATDIAQTNAIADRLNNSDEQFQRWMNDLTISWPVLLGCVFVCLVLCFVWLLFLRMFAGMMIWFIIIAVFALFLAMTIIAYMKGGKFQQYANDPLNPLPSHTNPNASNAQTMLSIAYTLTVIDVILFVVIFFMRKRINIAIGVIKEATRAINAIPQIIFFPIINFVLIIALFGFWLPSAAYLTSSGEKTATGWHFNQDLKYMMVYFLFGLLWTLTFIVGIGQMTLAGAIGSWYWVHDKREMPSSPVTKAFYRTCRYHLGTLAFGAFIIAVVQMIRIILAYIQAKSEKWAKDNMVIKCMFVCVNCCLACFEKFLKFINKNAYILVAIHGWSFCHAAKEAFKTVVANALRVSAVTFVGGFFLFLGRLGITVLTGCVAYAIIENHADYTEVTNPFFPVMITMIIAWCVSSSFLSVFDMAVDTIMLSFCLDEEMNKESGNYFATEDLRTFLTERQKIDPSDGK
eukprot:GFYU01014362.1.p1 GENE.GFYU01014362.1~~GFYU01014362.1.p1  ORF type:complete len:634 (+),score=225.77 GFYU01014362.1:114-2015(+)